MSTATLVRPLTTGYTKPMSLDLDRIRQKYTVARWAHQQKGDTRYALELIREADSWLSTMAGRVQALPDGDPVNNRDQLLETVQMLRDIRRTLLAFAG